ncbi:hypothetical protein RRG08_041897 [Elysia crispata]|uniref:Uncharacterized protein n=1 Tax=Elysia crispata TaxID=231223 RepID=A0AAE1CQP4_9GAST|nr:hypothetical protein RRG08_041897 [Elysia crispata]
MHRTYRDKANSRSPYFSLESLARNVTLLPTPFSTYKKKRRKKTADQASSIIFVYSFTGQSEAEIAEGYKDKRRESEHLVVRPVHVC